MYRSLVLLLTCSERSLSLNRSFEFKRRRVHGLNAKIEQFSYVGYLHFDLSHPPTCGSSLILAQAILTAAHCMLEMSKKDVRILASFGAEVPKYSNMTREVVGYKIHPKYDTTNSNNLAVAYLEYPVTLSKIVTKIPMADWYTLTGTIGWSVGWKRQTIYPKKRTDYSDSRSMKATKQILLSKEECELDNKKSPLILCTRSEVGLFYKEDAGNGLIITKPSKILIGVFSHNVDDLAYYSSVYSNRNWIIGAVKSLFEQYCNKKTLICRSVNIAEDVTVGNCSVVNEFIIS